MFPRTRHRSRIAHFKAPFIVSVAGSAALGIACGGQTNGTGLGGDDANLTECPADPIAGTSCAAYVSGLTCETPYCYSTVPTHRCGEDGLWHELPVPTCNPPPPDIQLCPSEMPVAGADCMVDNMDCRYGGCQGPESSEAHCTYGQWQVQYSSGPACNPPFIIPVCPELEPTPGAGCAFVDQECDYGSCGSDVDPARRLGCTSAGWVASSSPCSAPDAGAAVDAGAVPGNALP